MISKLAVIDGIEQTVINPMINDIVRDINNQIIQDKDAFINKETVYNKENVEFADYIYDNAIGGSNIDVNYEIIENEDFNVKSSVMKPINKIFLLDKDNSLHVRPVYINTDIELTFTYRGQNKSQLLAIKNRLRLYYNNSLYRLIHNLNYSFILPSNLMSLLENVNRLKNNGTVSIEDYIKSISVYKIDFTTTRNKDYKAPVFRGKQLNVIGIFLDEPKDLTVEKADVPEYSLTFKYIVTIQKPIGMLIQYPILINNKPLDSIWLPNNYVLTPKLNANNELDIANIVNISLSEDNTIRDFIYKVPEFDDFTPLPFEKDYNRVRLMSILIEVNSDDLYTILNLEDLRYVGLPDKIIDYLKLNKNDIFEFANSLFYIELFEFDYVKDLGLYIDDEFNIKTTKPLDITKSYHILINIMTNLNFINYPTDDNTKLKNDIELLDYYNIDYTYRITDKNRLLAPVKNEDL